tara:strand:- start:9154 stop:9264 length:111 start_codon:yes stop_codon:yes gene_type:complete
MRIVASKEFKKVSQGAKFYTESAAGESWGLLAGSKA